MSTTTSKKPLTVVARNGDNVTVRTNTGTTFNGGIPFNGSVSGSIPAGAIFSGRDSNHNNVPDILERPIRNGNIRFQ